ncbi:hypothetical protein [Parafrankia sp. FMc2]|uniref:nSTAND1 domain-containing NTPase n=1 Tax=Parafrankia sp. FMc2 TaxID=3233196 RepID=UPI0034D6EBB2
MPNAVYRPAVMSTGESPAESADAAGPEEAGGDARACPYPGLRGFDESSEQWFFGRERMVADLLARVASTARVRSQDQNLNQVHVPDDAQVPAQAPWHGPLVLVGASGSGKSSLLRAGLLPALAGGALAGSAGWPRLVMTPGERPLEILVQRTVETIGMPAMARLLRDSLRGEPERFGEVIGELLTGRPTDDRPADGGPADGRLAYERRLDGQQLDGQQLDGRRRVVIAVDQFEEIFTQCDDQAEREAFVRALCSAAAGGGDAVVVLGLRADFYGQCAAFPELVEMLQVNQVVVGPMAAGDIREIVVRPARAADRDVEPGLVELVLRDLGAVAAPLPLESTAPLLPPTGAGASPGSGGDAVAGFIADPGALPLLAHALRATWLAGSGDTLTVADYLRVGGLTGAVAQTAEAVYTGLDAEAQQAVRPLLMRMIRIGENGADTRRRTSRAALLAEVPSPAAASALDALIAARLVEADAGVAGDAGVEAGTDAGTGEAGRGSVQIAHEALVRAWPRLREWLDMDRTGAVALQQLGDAAEVWERGGRDPSYLFSGSRLAAAREWVREASGDRGLSPVARRFFEASVAAEAERERAAGRRGRRLRRLVAALAVLLLVAASLAGLAYEQSVSSARERDQALSQRIATQAQAARRDNPALAAQLSLVALRTADTPEARGAVLSAFNGGAGVPSRYPAHGRSAGAVAFSRDGALIATGSDDWTATLWDARDPRRRTPLARLPDERGGGHGRAVKAVAFNRDGSVLATGGADGLTKLWDITDRSAPRLLATLPRAEAEVYGLAFDPVADRLAVGGYGNTAYLFDVADPGRPAKVGELYLHLAPVVALEFAPDGQFLVAGDRGGSALVWYVGDPSRPLPVKVLVEDEGPSLEQAGAIRSVAFADGGRTVYTTGESGYVRRFTGPDLLNLRFAGRGGTGESEMTTVAAAPSGGLVAVAGPRFLGVSLYDLGAGERPLTFLQEGPNVWDVAFSPDGSRLATASSDGSLRVWEVPGPALIGRDGEQQEVAVSPATDLVALTTDTAVELWDVTDTYAPRARGVLRDAVVDEFDPTGSAAFSPDGRTLAVGTARNIVFYDVADPARPVRISAVAGPLGGASRVLFSPDGRTLAVGGFVAAPARAFEVRVELWDVGDLARPQRLASAVGHRSVVRYLDFSPDGTSLVSVADRSVRIWDVSGRRQVRPRAELPEFPGGVWEARFSPDGRTLAVGGAGPFATLWDVADPAAPRQLADLPGHTIAVLTVAFSPDGRSLVTGSNDNTVRVWDVTDRDDPTLVERLARSSGAEAGVGAIAFTRDGERLVGVVYTEPGVVWDLDLDRVRARICERAGVGVTESEWRQFVPDLSYDPPCD